MSILGDGKTVLLKHCEKSLCIMNSYYSFAALPPIEPFIIIPNEITNSFENKVLLEENDQECFLGIQFSAEIYDNCKQTKGISAHHVSVISEELSHFKFLCDVIENDQQTSLLILETLGEIDRFLCLLHWNSIVEEQDKIPCDWQNIHEVCDFIFCGDRFLHGKNKALYIKAENLAFKHLKEAFSGKWDCSYFNFSKVDRCAQNYLSSLRLSFLAS